MAYGAAWRESKGLKNLISLKTLRRHRAKFVTFVGIGGGLFVLGLLIQAVLTSRFRVGSVDSYLVQAVVTNELSFVLNYRITWRSANTPWLFAFWRFNAQKVITVTVNLMLYWCVVRLGVDYLVANVLLAIVFTFVNYVGAEKFVFLTSVRLVTAVTGELPHHLSETVLHHHHHDDADSDPRAQQEGLAALVAIASQQRTGRAAAPGGRATRHTRHTRPDLVAVPGQPGGVPRGRPPGESWTIRAATRATGRAATTRRAAS